MRLASILPLAALSMVTMAHAASVQAVLTPYRNQIEASDYRATGQLIRVDANGNRTSYAIAVKGLWFAGAMHTLLDVTPPKTLPSSERQHERMRLLVEMRPDGRNTIEIFRPNAAAPTALPFSEWNGNLLGTALSYEDLLDQQYFWPNQTILKTAKFGAHQCNVLESTPASSDRTHYSEVQTWLDSVIDYPVYAEKTMKRGGTVKEFTYYGLRQSSGVWSATQVEIKVRGGAGSTFLTIKRGSARANLRASDFHPEQISRFEDHP